MISLGVELSPDAIVAASSGDTGRLDAELEASDIEGPLREALTGTLTDPASTFDLVEVGGGGTTVRRGIVGPSLALLHGDGDDRQTATPIIIASSGAELLHVVLNGIGFGVREPSTGPSDAVTLTDPEAALRAVLGLDAIPTGLELDEDRSPKLWSLTFDRDDVAPIVVIDAARLWRQTGEMLKPMDAMSLWSELSPVLTDLNRLALQSVAPDAEPEPPPAVEPTTSDSLMGDDQRD